MRRSVPLLLAALLVAAGCGSAAAPAPGAPPAEPAAPAAPPPETDPVRWTERVCEAMAPFIELNAAAQDVPDPADPAAAVAALKERSEKADAATTETLDALDAVGPSPVADGDAFVEELSRLLTDFQAAFRKVGESAAAIDPAAPDSQEKARAAITPLTEVPPPDETKLGNDTETVKLMQGSPQCAQVGSFSG